MVNDEEVANTLSEEEVNRFRTNMTEELQAYYKGAGLKRVTHADHYAKAEVSPPLP